MNPRDMREDKRYKVYVTDSALPYVIYNVEHHEAGVRAHYASELLPGWVYTGLFEYANILTVEEVK